MWRDKGPGEYSLPQGELVAEKMACLYQRFHLDTYSNWPDGLPASREDLRLVGTSSHFLSSVADGNFQGVLAGSRPRLFSEAQFYWLTSPNTKLSVALDLGMGDQMNVRAYFSWSGRKTSLMFYRTPGLVTQDPRIGYYDERRWRAMSLEGSLKRGGFDPSENLLAGMGELSQSGQLRKSYDYVGAPGELGDWVASVRANRNGGLKLPAALSAEDMAWPTVQSEASLRNELNPEGWFLSLSTAHGERLVVPYLVAAGGGGPSAVTMAVVNPAAREVTDFARPCHYTLKTRETSLER